MSGKKHFRLEDFLICDGAGKPLMGRLSYPWLAEPQTDEDTGYQRYNCQIIFPKGSDVTGLQKKIAEVVIGEWGPTKGPEMFKEKLIRNPLLDGGGPYGRDKPELGAGTFFIRPASAFNTAKPRSGRPICLRYDRGAQAAVDVPVADIPTVFYPGCWVYAVINAYAWEAKKGSPKEMVCFGLTSLRFAKDGDRLSGGGGDPSKHFEAIVDDEAAAGAPIAASGDASSMFT